MIVLRQISGNIMRLRQICTAVVRRNVGLQSIYAKRLFATESKNEVVDITSADEKPIYSETAEDKRLQAEIAQKQNKSRLSSSDRNILMGLRPYDAPKEWYHNTVRYKRRMLGRYGLQAIDEPAGLAWPTVEDLKDAQEYERVAFPLTLQERWKKLEKEHQEMVKSRIERETKILEKLGKMDKWRDDLQARIHKKAAEMEKARIRKERVVEEVRRHFGFNISPHDSRFKEMLEQKEKEEKKQKKEAKKKARIDRLSMLVHKEIEGFSKDNTSNVEKEESKQEDVKKPKE